MTSPPALLIAAPGARHDAAAAAFQDFVALLGSRHPEVPVAGGLIGAERWPVTDAVDELVAAGAARLTAVSLALVPEARAENVMAEALTAAREEHPELSVAQGRPLGPDPALLAVLEQRLDEAIGADKAGRTPRDRAEVTVLLVAPGSTEPDANAEVHRAARLLWEGRGYAGVETAFVSSAAPDVPTGLDRCVRLGAQRIIVLPYVLFDGGPVERARLHAEGWAEAHPETNVRFAETIGPVEELADLVVERFREAVAAPVPAQPEHRRDDHARAH
ncbi:MULTISPECIES: sirohydrochlorin chelatase [unclassified Streptomyces]|uniref:sirohydrochlorin chelatase n=1 Tax=unclassified Streptomyces TaxID=2593676 RepID=UPI0021C7ECB5|nr:sirohydrochlorin chelatase [Streptomyces sp. FIT100]UUN26171.1 sirohydrochlorin chelatase [Streptomyces sp. FIT100]